VSVETKSQKIERLKKLKARKIDLQRRMVDYREGNLLEFFDKAPNPGPNPKQAQVLEAFLDPFYKTFGMSGGNRLGKTTLLTIIGLSVVFGKFLWNNQSLLPLFPHKRARKVRYIGQGWQDHIKAVVIPELDKWWPKARPVERHGNGVITDTFWKDVKTGGTIEIMSNNQRPKEHEGWSGDLILYDEPPRREIYVANARGLVDRLGREIFAATLLEEPWVDREIVRKVDDEGRPDKTVFWIQGSSYDNVGYGITKAGIEEFANKLSEGDIEARIHGIPQYMQGLVYPQFNRKIHLVERFEIPLDWMVDIAVDVHPREKQAVLFVATDPKNERYVVEEIWNHGDAKWVAEHIVKAVKYHNFRVNRIIIDPLAKGDSNNERSVYETISAILLQYGYVLEVASKDKEQGILEVKKHLKGPNNMPSLRVFDDLTRFLYEIEGYMWDKETQKPVDKDDHMMENLYRVCLLDTHWEAPEAYDDFWEPSGYGQFQENRDAMTGY